MKPNAGTAGEGAKYFARYAEPEAKLAHALSERYLAALVVPVCGEGIEAITGRDSAVMPGCLLVKAGF